MFQSLLKLWEGSRRLCCILLQWSTLYIFLKCQALHSSSVLWIVKGEISSLVLSVLIFILSFKNAWRHLLFIKKTLIYFLLISLIFFFVCVFQIWIENSVFAKRISKPVYWGQTNTEFFLSAGMFSSTLGEFAEFLLSFNVWEILGLFMLIMYWKLIIYELWILISVWVLIFIMNIKNWENSLRFVGVLVDRK